MVKFLNRLIDNKISSRNLGVFRILYCLVLLFEAIRLYRFQHLVYDAIPYRVPSVMSTAYALDAWFITLFCLILGYKTRFFSVVNYLLSLLLIGTATQFEYHVFYGYMGVNFLLMFTPISDSLSVDNLLKRLNTSTLKKEFLPEEKVSEFYSFLLVFVGVGLVYFDSILFKLQSPLWLSGLGIWLPASMPFAVNLDATPILNQEWLMKGLCYLTIIFEAVFLFLFWNRRFKLILLLIGICLHIGIYIFFPIPQFAQFCIVLYVLMLPPIRLNFKKLIKQESFLFFYDKECPLCIRTKIVVEYLDVFGRIRFVDVQTQQANHRALQAFSFDDLVRDVHGLYNGKIYKGIDVYLQVFRKSILFFPIYLLLSIPGIYHFARWFYTAVAKGRSTERCTAENCEIGIGNYPEVSTNRVRLLKNLSLNAFTRGTLKILFFGILLLQMNVSLQAPLPSQALSRFGFYSSITRFLQPLANLSHHFLGITHHGLFMDSHFNHYNHNIRIDCIENGKRITLPIIDERGLPSDYLYNFVWANWTFRVNGPTISNAKLEAGIKRYTVFWLYKTKRAKQFVGAHHFEVLCKKTDTPVGFEKDFLKRQIAKPWFVIGTADWQDDDFSSAILPVEQQ